MSKALLIKSYTDIKTGVQGQWNELTMASSYIQGIETGKILDGLSADSILNCVLVHAVVKSRLPCNLL